MSFLGKALAGAAGSMIAGAALGAASNLISQRRSLNLPGKGEISKPKAISSAKNAISDKADWRVRLSMPPVDFITSSPVLTPLREAGGLIFPFTPSITINHSANYAETTLTHQNYQFITYQYSKVSDITIVGDFAVEDAVQAQYWLACIHFLRTVTKMFTGDTPNSGNPPPILNFNAYGDYVFKDIPVVVKSFGVTMPKDVDYIATQVGKDQTSTNANKGTSFKNPLNKLNMGSMLAAGVSNAFANTNAGKIGAGLLGIANKFNGSQSFNAKNLPKAGEKSGENDSHVPVQSTITITIMPVYSRTKIRQFNLQDFVSGKLVKGGYV